MKKPDPELPLVRPDLLADLLTYQTVPDVAAGDPDSELIELDGILERARTSAVGATYRLIDSYRKAHPSSPLFEASSIFEPMAFERMETAVSSSFAWLMDLDKPVRHGYEAVIHRSMVESIFPLGTSPGDFPDDFRILREIALSNRSRLDLAFLYPASRTAILVEMKLDSSERVEQLDDYSFDLALNPIFRGYQCSKVLLAPAAHEKSSDSNGEWLHVHWETMVPRILSAVDRSSGKSSHEAVISLVVSGLIRGVCGWNIGNVSQGQAVGDNIFDIETALELLNYEDHL